MHAGCNLWDKTERQKKSVHTKQDREQPALGEPKSKDPQKRALYSFCINLKWIPEFCRHNGSRTGKDIKINEGHKWGLHSKGFWDVCGSPYFCNVNETGCSITFAII